MWCDDFDLDLLKVLPEAFQSLKPVKDIKLFTHGHLTGEKLDHPSVWNDNLGIIAYFGFVNPCKPEGYWTNDPLVECTFEEAIRDCWCHHYAIILQRELIWDGNKLWPYFESIMWHTRGWGETRVPYEEAKREALGMIDDACFRMMEWKQEPDYTIIRFTP